MFFDERTCQITFKRKPCGKRKRGEGIRSTFPWLLCMSRTCERDARTQNKLCTLTQSSRAIKVHQLSNRHGEQLNSRSYTWRAKVSAILSFDLYKRSHENYRFTVSDYMCLLCLCLYIHDTYIHTCTYIHT